MKRKKKNKCDDCENCQEDIVIKPECEIYCPRKTKAEHHADFEAILRCFGLPLGSRDNEPRSLLGVSSNK